MIALITHRIATGVLSASFRRFVCVFGSSNAQAPEPAPQVVPAVLPSTTTTSTTLPALVTTCAQVATLALAEGLPPSELETAYAWLYVKAGVQATHLTRQTQTAVATAYSKLTAFGAGLDLLAYRLVTS
jgi:hypothetical protein